MSIHAALTELLGPEHVLGANRIANLDPGIDDQNLGCDVYVRPEDAGEVSAVLKRCAETRTKVVPHGGRTGLSGAARSRAGEVVVSTERMLGLEIDPFERVAVVGAGVTLQALQEACAEHGLSPGIDIAARGSATIGGMISTNAGGMECWRNGMMRDRLLGMEVVIPNGDILRDLTRVKKANEGYDLKQLFCGAEGTLGVVTQAVLRLERLEPPGQTILCAVQTAADGIRVMRSLQDTDRLMRAEAMWRTFAHDNARCLGLPHLTAFHDAPLYVIYETRGDLDDAMEALGPFMEDGTIENALMASSERERAEIWTLREDSQPIQREFPAALWFDNSVPLGRLDDYVADLTARIEAMDFVTHFHVLGHLGDGNLHMTVAGAGFSDEQKTAVQMAVEAGVKEMGGAISAEHGVGEDKRASLLRCDDDAHLDAMEALKSALDQQRLMNLGKVLR